MPTNVREQQVVVVDTAFPTDSETGIHTMPVMLQSIPVAAVTPSVQPP